MSMTTADGQALPEPLSRQTHHHGFYKSSEGRHVSARVLEIRYAALVTLTLADVTEGWEFLGLEYLTSIVVLRLAEGWIVSASSERYFLLLPPPEPVGQLKPVCSRCGSEDLARDACVRWDKSTGCWALSAIYEATFCDGCHADGDDIARWVSVADSASRIENTGASST